MPQLSWAEWDAKAKYRCLHYKFKEQLDWLKDFYPEKIDRLQRRLDDILAGYVPALKEDILLLQEKMTRLTDKFETVLKEIEGRRLGHFKNRPEHGTTYYIDLDAGNDGNDGLGTGTAWLTLAKYTTTTVRAAGDEAKVRANTDEAMAADLVFDEDGDEDNYIEIRGCSVADDPWGDSSNVKPILTFGDNVAQVNLNDDNFWKIDRMIVKESADVYGNMFIGNVMNAYIKDSEFTDASHATTARGVSLATVTGVLFDGCVFKDNIHHNMWSQNPSRWKLKSCTFNGGALGTQYGIRTNTDLGRGHNIIEAIDCDFGQTTSHGTEDIEMGHYHDIIKLRNCKLDKATIAINTWGGVAYEEDADGVAGAGLITYYHGTVTKDTSIKTGSANFSLKFEPNANCGVNNPLTANNDSQIEYPFIIECTGGVSKTVTVQIRSLGTWGTYPIATELFFEFWYLDHATNATRTKVVSTDVLSHASNWVSFTCTFTPLQTGLAYGTVKLGKFEDAGDGAYCNGEAT